VWKAEQPLRHPAVGVGEHKMQDLPYLGVIENPLDGDLFGRWSNLAGLNILCLGMSEAQVDKFLAPHAPGSVTMLAYWANHIDAQSASYPIVVGDITKRTDFDSDQFDAVITMSVLEHVSNLGTAFDEMARVVRPGGEMLHMFGPVWSSPYGHHLCGADDADPNLAFFRWKMPAHMHLLWSEIEVCDYYERLGYSRELGQSVYNEFHLHDHINRFFYDDYLEVMSQFQMVRAETMYNALPADHLRALRKAEPSWRDFSTYGGCYKLLVE
jgi:SAM-dependent methyltransferase